MTDFLILNAAVGFVSEGKWEGLVMTQLEKVTELWGCPWSECKAVKERESSLLSYPSVRVQGQGEAVGWMCPRERLETFRNVSWKQCCPETLTEQGHVNWSLMGQRPFSIYHLMLKNACDRTPDGVQMWRGFAWTFSCSEFPKQFLHSEKLRFITILHSSHLWMETPQS